MNSCPCCIFRIYASRLLFLRTVQVEVKTIDHTNMKIRRGKRRHITWGQSDYFSLNVEQNRCSRAVIQTTLWLTEYIRIKVFLQMYCNALLTKRFEQGSWNFGGMFLSLIYGWFHMKALRKKWNFFFWIFDQKSLKFLIFK